MSKGKRNVRWFEARQERAQFAAWRRERLAALIVAAERVGLDRVEALCRDAVALREAARRYGRAKARIGVYDRAYGWRDPLPPLSVVTVEDYDALGREGGAR